MAKSPEMNEFLMSPVKRERAKKKAKLERKEQMRSELPVLDRYEIRRLVNVAELCKLFCKLFCRHRLPLHQALVEELQENGYLSSASFLQQLIDYNEFLRNESGPDTPVWCRPRLIDRKDVLTDLAETFKKAEIAHFDSK